MRWKNIERYNKIKYIRKTVKDYNNINYFQFIAVRLNRCTILLSIRLRLLSVHDAFDRSEKPILAYNES